jgi:hypothetical protein
MSTVYPAPTRDPARTHFGGFIWSYDPAASGPRERVIVDGWDLQAYYVGRWVVVNHRLDVLASGAEVDLASAQTRVVKVYHALVGTL